MVRCEWCDTELRDASYVTLPEGVAAFLDWTVLHNKRPKTVVMYRNALTLFTAWMGEMHPHAAVDAVTPPLLAACSARDTFMSIRRRAMLLLALDTGLRRSELRGLDVENVNAATGRTHVPAVITKTHRQRTGRAADAGAR